MKGQFEKGKIPWNKGKRMKPETYKKCKPTMFKKGGIPPSTKYFGRPYLATRIRKNGYKEQRWLIHHNQKRMSYLVYLCELNGIDLEGRKPRLKPGFDINKEPTIDDIIVVSEAENMRLNSVHNYPEELQKLIQIYGALSRQINKRK